MLGSDRDYDLPFDVAWLVDEARRRTGGHSDFGAGPFLEPLALLVESLEKEGYLTPIGKIVARERCLGHMVNRLNYVHDRKLYPAIARQRIFKPIFIVGFPRTGTTILHDILARDPATRAPLTWEVMFPSPPPRTELFDTDPRIAMCAGMMPRMDEAQIAFKAMHPSGPLLTQECVSMMGEAMCTPLFHNQFRVPAYQHWVDYEADWRHVYHFHKMQLQHLQSEHARDRWVLKTGAHLWAIDQLLAAYPDARIVFTHRDPVKSLTSFASLCTLVRSMFSDRVDRAEIAEDWIERLTHVLSRVLALRSAQKWPDAILLDVQFSDFIRDQFAVVERIYEAFDLKMTDQGARAMKAFIDDNPPGKYGVHRYSPEEFGISPSDVRSRLRPYIERFDLGPE